jgi:hypothetical protein
MKLEKPNIPGATVIAVSYGPKGRIKELVLETELEVLNLEGVPLAPGAEIEVRCIRKWEENSPQG